MAEIIIKKKLSLDFLGDDNKNDYLVFRSVPVMQYDDMVTKINSVKDGDNKSATLVMLDMLKEYLVDGMYGGQKVEKEDLDGLDGQVVVRCFETLTGKVPGEDGASIDPKVGKPSTKQSSTEPKPPESS